MPAANTSNSQLPPSAVLTGARAMNPQFPTSSFTLVPAGPQPPPIAFLPDGHSTVGVAPRSDSRDDLVARETASTLTTLSIRSGCSVAGVGDTAGGGELRSAFRAVCARRLRLTGNARPVLAVDSVRARSAGLPSDTGLSCDTGLSRLPRLAALVPLERRVLGRTGECLDDLDVAARVVAALDHASRHGRDRRPATPRRARSPRALPRQP